MLIDARTIPRDTVMETDVCIIGAGAAGITLARELIGTPLRVCLLESGGLELDAATQQLYQGETVGHPYYPLEACRLRYFGGTTNHWAGWSSPIDPLDFTSRAWVPHSGWPFGRDQLDKYYRKAQMLCQLGPYTYEAADWTDTDATPLLLSRVVSRVEQLSPPTRFGVVYRDEVLNADNISTCLHANVTQIETTEAAAHATAVRVACLSGNAFQVKARLFVLACGGIENARLLLLSNTAQPAGLGNQHDLVGRYFMEHLLINRVGKVLLSSADTPTQFYSHIRQMNATNVGGYLTFTESAQRELKLLSSRFSGLHARVDTAPLDRSSRGMRSLRQALRALWHGELTELWTELGNVVSDLDGIALAAYHRLMPRPEMRGLSFFSEQAPNPDSRVTLAMETDALGLRKVRLDWRLSDLDRTNLQRSLELLGAELGRAGLGRVQIEYRDEDIVGSYHHMGTTRMHTDPKQGVVDANCRVHGMDNLYIAGSSVFPTSGADTTTLTIVALTLRLAEHLRRTLS